MLEQRDYQLLIYRYPVLRHFIFECWKERNDDKLLDFIFSLETEEQYLHKGH